MCKRPGRSRRRKNKCASGVGRSKNGKNVCQVPAMPSPAQSTDASKASPAKSCAAQLSPAWAAKQPRPLSGKFVCPSLGRGGRKGEGRQFSAHFWMETLAKFVCPSLGRGGRKGGGGQFSVHFWMETLAKIVCPSRWVRVERRG